MFTVDPQTRMIWFRPAPLEPDWKFKMLGVLFSLAVYNGITLPVTFPLVFYQYLLGHQDTTILIPDTIRDGWPSLAKSLDELLAWDNGDVGDVFMRDYTFSFDSFGQTVDVDMQAFRKNAGPRTLGARLTPSDLSDPRWIRVASSATTEGVHADTPLVTNDNRDQFVRDYIAWLTHLSVSRQLGAFRAGFLTCLRSKSLKLFTPATLRSLIEGSPSISIPALKAATRYESGYFADHATIRQFWDVVGKYDEEDKKRLLEFVTASERVPVTGFQSMNFYIVRSGEDSEMLPTSSTCFGKLMLPEYANEGKLEEKLGLAIRNSSGFGVV